MGAKGEQTKEMILREASRLFNQKGTSGLSMSQVLKATGLQKGGLYNHFKSKEDLAAQSFDYAVSRIKNRFETLVGRHTTAIGRLHALIAGFREYYHNPPLPGGCPLMNAAIEHDDANPRLRARARQAMEQFMGSTTGIVKGGIKRGELREDVDPNAVANLLISTFEGALMLSKVCQSPVHLERAADFMEEYVNGLKRR